MFHNARSSTVQTTYLSVPSLLAPEYGTSMSQHRQDISTAKKEVLINYFFAIDRLSERAHRPTDCIERAVTARSIQSVHCRVAGRTAGQAFTAAYFS